MSTVTAPSRATANVLLRALALGLLVALALVAVVYGVAKLAGDPLVVRPPGQASQGVTLVVAWFATLVGGLLGLGAAFVARLLPRPRTSFLAITLVGLLVSFAQPFTASSGATPWWLNLMHVAAAAGLIPPLARVLPEHKP